MNITEMYIEMAHKSNLNITQSMNLYNALNFIVAKELRANKEISIDNLGTFYLSKKNNCNKNIIKFHPNIKANNA